MRACAALGIRKHITTHDCRRYAATNAAIAGMTANRTEVSFANIAKKIYDGDFAEADTIVKAIEEDMIDDADFPDFLRTSFFRQIVRHQTRGEVPI